MDEGKSGGQGKSGRIVEIPRQKPASNPEILEFLRELLILAHETQINLLIVGVATEDAREANGVYVTGTTLRDIERLQDCIDTWVGDIEYEDEE